VASLQAELAALKSWMQTEVLEPRVEEAISSPNDAVFAEEAAVLSAPAEPVACAVARQRWDGEGTSGDAGDYLMFPAGARIEVVREGEPGDWWQGRLDSKVGWFPSSFTDMQAEMSPSTSNAAHFSATRFTVPQLPKSFSMRDMEKGFRSDKETGADVVHV